jgi:hypothetical protein
MADLTVTATSVLKTAGSVSEGIAGGTITAGQSVYFNSATQRWLPAQCDGTTEEAGASGIGVALNGAAIGQPVDVQVGGTYNPGATVAVGQQYHVSAAAGGICPYGDLISTNKVTYLGVGTTAAEINLTPIYTGIAKA